MKDQYGIETWYLAGNCIDGETMHRIADALEHNTVCKSLWLKRNPIGPKTGAEALGRLLARNRHIEVLDLHNTGLCDAGMVALNAAEEEATLVSDVVSEECILSILYLKVVSHMCARFRGSSILPFNLYLHSINFP